MYATARHAAQLDDLVAQNNGRVVAVELDVTDFEAIGKLADSYPDVTLVVNNAGYAGVTTSIGDIDAMKIEMAVNHFAASIAKAFSGIFSKASSSETDVKPSGLVNIASIASFVNFPVAATYSASKAAIHSLTQAQRRDFPNALVVGVHPGPIDTAMAEDFNLEKSPLSKVGSAVVEALLKGKEEVFLDPMSLHLHESWQKDAKALEKEMASFTA